MPADLQDTAWRFAVAAGAMVLLVGAGGLCLIIWSAVARVRRRLDKD